MIGNGFDLEHGLPTKYTDFLKFIKDFNQAYYSPHNTTALQEFENIYFSAAFRSGICPSDHETLINALRKLIYGNLWINYFIKVHDEHLFLKENWIDFESEISSVVQAMDRLIKYYAGYKLTGVEDTALYHLCMETLTKFVDKESLKIDKIKSNIKPMIFDLNRLICALEIYIAYYINHMNIQYYNPDIFYNAFDKIISFNYSHTYWRLYTTIHNGANYHFVHGYTRSDLRFLENLEKSPNILENYMSGNNMVLGIDEYLPDDRKDKETAFLPFKKYYQRIYKNTTNNYKNWLKEIDAKPEFHKRNTLYIFGHSLDVTDGDILRDLINHKGINTVIYYKNKKQLEQQITNLVKVLGSDTVIEKVYGNDSCITFQQQGKRQIKVEGEVLLRSTILGLNAMPAPGKELDKAVLNFIKEKIEEKNLKYFSSQHMVISLYDSLQKLGLGEKYFNKLLPIACKLPVNSTFGYEQWAYTHFDNSFKCDKDTMHFIDCVNEHNSNIVISDQSKDLKNLKYDHISNQRICLDKTPYSQLVKEILSNLDGYYCGSYDKYWNYLVKISCGPAKKIAREAIGELINNTDDDCDIIQYNHLLRLMDEYEYKNGN